MAWIESPKKKKRRRYYKSKLKEFAQLNDKWTKEFQNKGFGEYLHRDSTAGGTTGGMLLAYRFFTRFFNRSSVRHTFWLFSPALKLDKSKVVMDFVRPKD